MIPHFRIQSYSILSRFVGCGKLEGMNIERCVELYQQAYDHYMENHAVYFFEKYYTRRLSLWAAAFGVFGVETVVSYGQKTTEVGEKHGFKPQRTEL